VEAMLAAGWDYDWGAWSAALVTASLVAPVAVVSRLDAFGAAVQVFLDTAGAAPSTIAPLDAAGLAAAIAPAERAQIDLVNAIRASVNAGGRLTVPLGGTFTGHPRQP